MVTNELTRCLNLLNFWNKPDDDKWKELLFGGNLKRDYVDSFALELSKNLATATETGQRLEVIRFYFIAINRFSNIPEDFQGIIFPEDANIDSTDQKGNINNTSTVQLGVISNINDGPEMVLVSMNHQVLLKYLYFEIQQASQAFHVPLDELCNDLGINWTALKIPHPDMPEVAHTGGTEERKLVQTKTSRLKMQLAKYNFEELKLVKAINQSSLEMLYKTIALNDLPYQVAMLDFLGFVKYCERNYVTTKVELVKIICEILGAVMRQVKGNLLVLNPNSRENRERYTSHLFRETVMNDYESLK